MRFWASDIHIKYYFFLYFLNMIRFFWWWFELDFIFITASSIPYYICFY